MRYSAGKLERQTRRDERKARAVNACGKTQFRTWTGRSGERRVYVNGRFCRGVSRHADGAFYVADDNGALVVGMGQGERRQVAAEIVAKDFGFLGAPFAEIAERFAKNG